MSSADLQRLQSEYLMELDLEHAALEPGGKPTRKSLAHLVNAAKLQRRMIALGVAPEQHEAAFRTLMERAALHAKQLGLLDEAKPAEGSAAPVGAPADSAAKAAPAAPNAPEGETDDADEGDPMEELQSLIGLGEAKKMIKDLIDQLAFNRMRAAQHKPTRVIGKHMVFAGHAGTGKTTVARLVGRILKKEGVLSKGHLCEVNAEDLIQGYVGQTLKKTDEVIQGALGGVLFIDEAYTLGRVKFGIEEAIPQLITAMENNRDDFAVIAAGYYDDMKDFIDANEGLKSRFTHWVVFEDYTPDQLYEIFLSMCRKEEWSLTPEADAAVRRVLEERSADPKFGNARGVRNLFDQCFMAISSRIADSDGETQDLSTFTEADILAASSMRTGI